MSNSGYPTRRFEMNGFDESEDFRTGSGKLYFRYLRRDGVLVDRILQCRMPTYGAAAGYCSLPVPYRARSTRWVVVIRTTPCRINGASADSGRLLLIAPDVEYEVEQEAGWEYGLDTEAEHLNALIGPRAYSSGVVAIPVDPRFHLRLQEMIRRELDGGEVEGGILAQALAAFDTGSENLITPAREMMACRVREAIDERLDGDVCLSDICLDLGVSIRTAERAFKLRFQSGRSSFASRKRWSATSGERGWSGPGSC
jgi:hypothetical protein